MENISPNMFEPEVERESENEEEQGAHTQNLNDDVMMFWDLLLSAKVKDFFSFWILIRSRGGIEEKTPWTDSQKCETPEAQKSHYIFLFRVTGHRKHGLNTTQHIHKYNIRMYSNYT